MPFEGNTLTALVDRLRAVFVGIGNITDLLQINKLKTQVIYPPADGATAIQITKADGTTVIITIDSTNGRVTIGNPPNPLTILHAYGAGATASIENTTAMGAGSGGAVRLGTNAIPTAADQVLGWLIGGYNDAGTWRGAAQIKYFSNGAWTAGTIQPSYIALLTTPQGSATQTQRLLVGPTKSLSNNTNTAIANCTLASNTGIAGQIRYSVEVFNGTDVQTEQGTVSFIANNKGGVFSGNTCVKFGNQQNMTAGTLTVTWTITGANPAILTVNANSSLASISAGYPRVSFTLENYTPQAVALA